MSDLGDFARDAAIAAAAGAVGKIVDKFLEDEPDIADKVKLGRDLLGQALALLPDDELRPHLDDAGRLRAEAVYVALKRAKYGSV